MAKWLWAPAAARAELNDPVAGFGLGLIGMATLMASIVLKGWAPGLAPWLFGIGVVGGAALAAWVLGAAWQGGRGLDTITPLTILPTVGTAYTGALRPARSADPRSATLLWGPGLVTWILVDSLVLLRLMTHPLPVPLRATIASSSPRRRSAASPGSASRPARRTSSCTSSSATPSFRHSSCCGSTRGSGRSRSRSVRGRSRSAWRRSRARR